MPWLWTDTLADLLDAVDRVPPEALDRLRRHPIAYRLADGEDALTLARAVLTGATGVDDPGDAPPAA